MTSNTIKTLTTTAPDYASDITMFGLTALSTVKAAFGATHFIESLVHHHDPISIAYDAITIVSSLGAATLAINAIYNQNHPKEVYKDPTTNEHTIALNLRTKIILYGFTGISALETVAGILHITKVDDVFGKVHGALNTAISLTQTIGSWGFLHFWPRPKIDIQVDAKVDQELDNYEQI